MRIARYRSPGNVHHIISRFNNQEFFIRCDADRDSYLRLLGRAMATSDWKCIAYAIMSNHIHLAMIAGEAPAEDWMRRVNPSFALRLNRELDRIGHIFADRARMWIVPPAGVADLIAYIHNNPVRAGVVARARDSSWTSHRAYVRLVQRPDWLHVDEGLARAGGCSPEALDALAVGADTRQERVPLEGVRREARKRGALELGTPTLDSEVAAPLLVRRCSFIRPDPQYVIDTVCSTIGIDVSDLRSRSREVSHVAARAIVMVVARNVGLAITTAANAIGLSPQQGSRLAMRALGPEDQAAAAVVVRRIERECLLGLRRSPEPGR